MNPLTRARQLARRVMHAGATLFSQTKATEISGTEVKTDKGIIRCKVVIVAVDGRLETVLPELCDKVRTTRL